MELVRCPICGLKQMKSGDSRCDMCKKGIFVEPFGIDITADFSRIESGRNYGTDPAKIYREFCKSLKWDWYQLYLFGEGQPLFATKADTERALDVWFVFHYNTSLSPAVLDRTEDSVVFVLNGGETIIEKRTDKSDVSFTSDRLIFVHDTIGENGYKFYGIYGYVGADRDMRQYRRTKDSYPIV
ncbi:MAG: hypothetical protein LUD47_01180 [Clostridia bacterium]|nr:hypothetical protein [Clostridia bacterium]